MTEKDVEGAEVEDRQAKSPPDANLQEAQNTTADISDPDGSYEYPEGGSTAWLQVLASHLINSMAWGYPATYGVYQLHYTQTMGLPAAQISWIGSIQVFLTFGVCTISGRLADAGYCRATVLCGSMMAVLGTFMTSLATQYWEILLAQGVCTGLGLGIMFMPGIAVIGSYFRRKRALALSIAATGTGTGSVVFPAIVQYLTPQVGFPWAVRCSAFVALFVSTVAILLIKPRLPPRKSGPLVEWSALKEPPYVLFAAGSFFFFWALYFGFFYVSFFTLVVLATNLFLVQINAYARNIIGFTTVDSVSLLLITNALGIPSRPLAGYVADHYIGPINTFIINVMILGIMNFCWAAVTTKTGMYVFSVFFGLANGAAQGVFVGALASLTSDPQKMGTRFGMVATLTGFATLAGPPTAGAIIDRSGGQYLWSQVWGGTVICLAAFTVAAARWWKTGTKLHAKV
jgi:MFS transporter, MCT family, solute carrier family 16 (monocarboxylic acid transporters), member 3